MKENVEENRQNSFFFYFYFIFKLYNIVLAKLFQKRKKEVSSQKKKNIPFSSDSVQPHLSVCASDLSIQVKSYKPWRSKKVLCVFYWTKDYGHSNILDIEA